MDAQSKTLKNATVLMLEDATRIVETEPEHVMEALTDGWPVVMTNPNVFENASIVLTIRLVKRF